MSTIYAKYKPFRNLIRDVEIENSLAVCWFFVNHLKYDKPIPQNIELDKRVNNSNDKFVFRAFVATEWELEFLVQEIILESPEKIYNKKNSLNQLHYRNRIIDHIRKTQDFSLREKLSDHNIFIELNRIAHRQFVWQSIQNLSLLFRYYKIFSYGKLPDLVEKNTGLPPFKLSLVGLAFTSYFTTYFSMIYPPQDKITFIDPGLQKDFVDYYSLDHKMMKEQVKQNRKYDDTLFYNFNPLRRYPLLKLSNKVVCPIPVLLYWQITSGTYYTICTEKDFDNDFGIGFQEYIKLVLEKMNAENKFLIHPEEKYGVPEKSTADLIFEDDKAIVFIECKTKRMVLGSKTSIDYSVNHERDIEILSLGLTQLYKTIEEYKVNNYPHLKYDPNKNIYPMLITLEEWYVNYNETLIEELNKKLKLRFGIENLNVDLLVSQPYHIRSCEEFEEDIQVMSSIGIQEYFNKYKDEKGRDAFKDFKFHAIFSEECKKTFHLEENQKITK